jgi:hypothetical protein
LLSFSFLFLFLVFTFTFHSLPSYFVYFDIKAMDNMVSNFRDSTIDDVETFVDSNKQSSIDDMNKLVTFSDDDSTFSTEEEEEDDRLLTPPLDIQHQTQLDKNSIGEELKEIDWGTYNNYVLAFYFILILSLIHHRILVKDHFRLSSLNPIRNQSVVNSSTARNPLRSERYDMATVGQKTRGRSSGSLYGVVETRIGL